MYLSLRKFRDQTLLTSALGKILVKLYYKISPVIASWIQDKQTIKMFLKFYLFRPLIRFLSKLKKRNIVDPNK